MVAGMKTEDIRRQHVQQYLALPRTDAERFRVGPGNVPEQGDGGLGYPGANEPRQQREVKILNQHDGTVGFRFRRDHVREFGVDLFVGVPIGGSERGPHVGEMTQRPQALIRESIVIALFLLGREPHPPQGIGGIVGRHSDLIEPVDGFAIGGSRAVRYPHTRTGSHDRLQGRHHAARRHLHHRAMIGVVIVDVRLAVRDDEHLRGVQVIVHHLFEGLRSPVLAKIDFQALLLLGLGQYLAHLGQDGLRRSANEHHRGSACPGCRRSARSPNGAAAATQPAPPAAPAAAPRCR